MHTIPVMPVCIQCKMFCSALVLDFMCKIQQNCCFLLLSPTSVTQNTFSFHEGKCQIFFSVIFN